MLYPALTFGPGVICIRAAPAIRDALAGASNRMNAFDLQLFYAFLAVRAAEPVGQFCSRCNFFKGLAGDVFGPFDIFAGREVGAKGWCSAWTKKTQ